MDVFHSKYKVLNKLGEGSFSEVLKVENRETGICYAAKRLKKLYKTYTSITTCAEIITSQKLPFHPNILNMILYHYDSFSGKVTFIFDLMDMSMYDYLKTKRRGLSEHRVKNYLFQMLRGLEHLHKHGLFHRDVKPENILIKFPSILYHPLSQANPNEIIKLADLGSVRGIFSAPPYTEYISTRWYRSPECLLTIGHYGSKMDIWAAGCVFYEMLTLRPLFPGSNEIDQLSKIHQIVGSPSIQFLSRLKSRSRNCIFFPKLKGTGVDILLPFITRSGRNILRLMIEYDPDKRINVKRLLRNCYFDDIRVTYEINMERYRPQARSQIWYRPNESLKRSMGDDGSICSNRCLVNKLVFLENSSVGGSQKVRNKILKREHYPDEIRSNKESRKKVFEDPNFLILPTEIPYYALKKPLQSNKSNLNYKTCSLPAVDQKILKTLSEDCKPKTDVKNRLVKNGSLKKKREQRFFKTTSNLETVKHDMDVKSLQKNTLQSKSFILPRRLGQHKIDTIKDKNVAVFQAKKNVKPQMSLKNI